MKVLSRVLTWIFLSCYIRHSFTIPKGHCPYCTQMSLLGIRHRDIVRGHDTYQVGFAFVPASYLSFKLRYSEVPLGATVGRISAAPSPIVSRWGVFWRGGSNEPRNLICPLGHCPTNTCSLLSGIPYSTWPSLPLYIRGSPWSRAREVEVRHLPPSVSRWGVKTGPECRGRALPSRHFWWHRVLFTMLNPSSNFRRGSLGITEEGSKYDAFPSTLSERRRSCLTRPAVLCSPRLRAVGLSLVLQCTSGRPFRPPPGPATRGFWLPPGVGFPPFLELTTLFPRSY